MGDSGWIGVLDPTLSLQSCLKSPLYASVITFVLYIEQRSGAVLNLRREGHPRAARQRVVPDN